MGLWILTARSRVGMCRRPRSRPPRDGQTLTFVTRQNAWTFLATPAGVTYWSRTDGHNLRLWWSLCADYEEVGKAMKRRSAPTNASAQKHLAAMETTVLSQCHSLVKHMAITQYEDGEVRKPGWITLKTFGSAWQIEAKDPDAALALRVVANSLDEALMLMALLLESEEAPWEPDHWLQQQLQKGRKSGK